MDLIAYEVELCVCCALRRMNGDVPGCKDSCGEPHTNTLLSFPGFCEEWEKIHGTYIEVEVPCFSWCRCAGCGSDLEGYRFKGTVYVG